ncbi:MAG: LrgB family protein, partial [Erysipelotrichaceae bacterium]|nr:LrgB family protein [Erysipelotrichaceae bacterium]
MKEFLSSSSFFGITLSLLAYLIAVALKKRFKSPLLNPLLVAIIITVAAVLLLNVDYEAYNSSAKYLSFLLTPATICLAVPLYEQFDKLKANAAAIITGILSGVLTSILSIFLLSKLFRFSKAEFVTFLPKSITTAIGLSVSEELGGYVSIT